ncbi:hypothetical protein [Escherichia coli]|uniref:hypothetical protein n=1 Tax=Escherichia coli TaxID=562 RepID=UPI0010CE6C00|nr:hypothetical protein BvCmsNSP056_04897 [Escherichia coli]
MTLSKILTDIFRTANNLTHCKTTNQLRAGDASIALASAILSCDRYSIFEQDFPRSGQTYLTDSLRQRDNPGSGLIRQAVRHSGHSVQISLVTTFTYSVPLSGALFRHMCPYPVVIQDNRFLFALPCRSYPPGQKCIIGKNVQKFFW